ncbi:MAG: monovalent cation/H(+) antiporter subunit G [Candidatus Methanoperedens sp.]|jgi:multicomponent Na+:H+ antiporter subunit G|nr:monovalent cation/H(+) antiporter subunit G [Candidatus Methanoperedens sp.]PKL54541.1 MAG: cation:proton antiporter [Candidatus Methanoperedenaceae archaeon HGW-Methanoperedenaceae-1]
MIEVLRLTLVIALLSIGAFLMLTAAVGMIRFPDVYSRMHASGKCDTLGLSLMLGGLIIYQGFDLVSVKMLFIIFFVLFTGPIAIHSLFRAAIKSGHEMWTKDGWIQWKKGNNK